MEKALEESNNAMPSREALQNFADIFSAAPERAGKMPVQSKQVWNWFQNRRHAVKKGSKPVVTTSPSPVEAPLSRRAATTSAAAPSGEKEAEPQKMEFEAKSSRDTAWYDVDSFLGHRLLESGEPEARVRFAGFGQEEDEWVNVRTGVRQRSLPCEAAECVAVIPGDLILCFQEGSEQALYYDARVKEVERRRHDIRGCRCRFLVQYDHDGVVEIVPLRKVCRRPETDHRLSKHVECLDDTLVPMTGESTMVQSKDYVQLSKDSMGAEGKHSMLTADSDQQENQPLVTTLWAGGSKGEVAQGISHGLPSSIVGSTIAASS